MDVSMQPRLPRRQPPAVSGRDRELGILSQNLSEMLTGRGSAVLIGGEAGIGKTTLVESIVSLSPASDLLILTGRCYDLASTPPFGPWIEMFGSYPIDSGLPNPPPELVSDRDMAGISSQAGLFQRLLAFITAVSTVRPLVLVLEDLHWVDDASLDLLRYIARSVANLRVMLLATYRDDEITRRHPLFQVLPVLVREAGAERLHIARLDQSGLELLVADRYDLTAPDRARLAGFLRRRSDGNPLYATELLRSLEEEDRIQHDDDGWRIIDLEQIQIPSLVQQVIETRLSRLDDSTQRLLDIASLIGQNVPLDLWSAVSEATDPQLTHAIEQAVEAGILAESDGGSSLRFTHALIREAIQQRQMLLRRRPWHLRVASALIASRPSDPDAIVYHLEQANDPRLVDWLIRSGERAQQRFAWPAAARQFDRAQAILVNDPDRNGERAWLLFRIAVLVRNTDHAMSLAHLEEAEQLAISDGDQVLVHLARAHKGLVLCYGSDVRQGLIDLEAGTLALERLDGEDALRLREMTTTWETILGVQGRATLAQWFAHVGRFQQARSLLADWNPTERDASADAHRAAGVIAANLGEPDIARRWFRRSRAVYLARNDRAQAGDDGFHEFLEVQIPYAADNVEERRELARTVQTLWTDPGDDEHSEWGRQLIAAVEHVISGRWSQAVELFGQNREHTRFMSSPFVGWWLTLARHRGETVAAWSTIRAALPDGPATEPGAGDYPVLAGVYVAAAELALDASDLPQAQAWLEAYDRLLDWSGAVRGRAENHLAWARYHDVSGNTAAARAQAELAHAHASNPYQPFALSATQRVLGTLACDDGRFSDAEQHLAGALKLADACAASFERALTLLAVAELRAATGQIAAARQLLVETRSICEPLQAAPTLVRLEHLEAQLRQRTAAGALPAGLSQREVEVLRLVAQGLSDAEVAEQLFIARRTVNTHLTAIYTKLGVNSRVAATRFAIEYGLV